MDNHEEKPPVTYVVQTSNSTVTIDVPVSDNIENPEAIPQDITPNEESKTAPVAKEEEPMSPDSEQANSSVATEALTGEIVEEKKKHPGGRPTKYNEEMLQRAIKYIDECMRPKDGKIRVPFIEEIALMLEVDEDTIGNWSDAHEEFFGAIKKLKLLQKLRLKQRVLNTKGNNTGSMFLLKAEHDLIESEKRILTGERNAEPLQLSVTNYKDANQALPVEAIAQMDQIAE